MSVLDAGVIAILAICGIIAYQKGFIKACLGFLPMCISLVATSFLQPSLSRFLRTTTLYSSLTNKISQTMQLEAVLSDTAMKTQTELINQMEVPDFLKSALIENNNPVVYQVLNVGKIEDYISGFLANICINIISLVMIFVAVLIISKVVLSALNLFAKLPILSFINKTCGLGVGLLQGVLIVWIAGIIVTFFYYDPALTSLITLLKQSPIALYLYNHNILLYFILKIFA